MRNIFIMLLLLLLPYWALALAHMPEPLRGRIGVAFVFAFTGIGHFIKTVEMAQMLPLWIPRRTLLIYLSGVFELLGCVGILIPQISRPTGIALCIFLVLVLPSNVYAAFQKVNFSGHAAGPSYLLVRVPLQLFLIGWIYWFAVR